MSETDRIHELVAEGWAQARSALNVINMRHYVSTDEEERHAMRRASLELTEALLTLADARHRLHLQTQLENAYDEGPPDDLVAPGADRGVREEDS